MCSDSGLWPSSVDYFLVSNIAPAFTHKLMSLGDEAVVAYESVREDHVLDGVHVSQFSLPLSYSTYGKYCPVPGKSQL